MKFSVDGTKYEFDETRLTFGEARALEKVTGYSIGELPRHTAGDQMEIAVLQGFIYTAMKRTQPDLAFSDLDDRNLGDIEFHDDEPGDAPPDPTGGAGDSTPAA